MIISPTLVELTYCAPIFLKDIHNVLNNTVLIFFSDHGIRFGKVRQMFVGKMEECLPFIFFIFPQWFMKKYPTYYKNLQTNSVGDMIMC